MAEAKKILTPAEFMTKMTTTYGKGTITLLSDTNNAEILNWSSTGIYTLDDIMAWGLPGGRAVEFFGAESSGKTTALMSAFIENKRRGGINLCADAEGTFDRDRYIQMGGDPADVMLFYPDTLEQYYDWLQDMIAWSKTQVIPSNSLVLIGVDTMPMLIPKEVLKSDAEDRHVGASARVNSENLPKVDKNLGSNTCLLMLNQVRDKIGAMAWSQEGNIDTPGGRIIKHIASVRVLFNKAGQLDNGKTGADRRIMGMKTGAKVVKNKIGPPLRKIEFRIMFDQRGVDNVDCCLEAFVAKGLIPKPKLGVYTIKGLTCNRNTFHKFLKSHPKWTTWALGETFELFHDSINIERYANILDIPVVEEATA